MVEEALPYAKEVIYTKEYPVLEKAKKLKIPCRKVTEKQYKKLSDVVTPQGIMAYVAVGTDRDLSLLYDRSLIIACIDIQDPGNMGTIIRTADAANVSGIIVSSGSVDLYNPKTVRSTAGSIFHVPVVHSNDIPRDITALKNRGFKIIAADTAGIEDFWQTDLTEKAVILIGNEGAGLSKEILGISDAVVRVPIPGKAESLNAAVCASVIIYEALRQRGLNG